MFDINYPLLEIVYAQYYILQYTAILDPNLYYQIIYIRELRYNYFKTCDSASIYFF